MSTGFSPLGHTPGLESLPVAPDRGLALLPTCRVPAVLRALDTLVDRVPPQPSRCSGLGGKDGQADRASLLSRRCQGT